MAGQSFERASAPLDALARSLDPQVAGLRIRSLDRGVAISGQSVAFVVYSYAVRDGSRPALGSRTRPTDEHRQRAERSFGAYNYLADTAANSPLVSGPAGSRNQLVLGAAFSWRFSW